MNGINYDKFKSPNSLVSQLELIGYISDKLNQHDISCVIVDEFAAEFYTNVIVVVKQFCNTMT